MKFLSILLVTSLILHKGRAASVDGNVDVDMNAEKNKTAGRDGDGVEADLLYNCNSPFQIIGNACLLINFEMRDTWNNMKDYCEQNGGDLISLKDYNLHNIIINYILQQLDTMPISASEDLDTFSENSTVTAKRPYFNFFIGANNYNGSFIYLDGKPVDMQSSLWSYQEPDINSPQKQCVYLEYRRFYVFVNVECGRMYHGICEKKV